MKSSEVHGTGLIVYRLNLAILFFILAIMSFLAQRLGLLWKGFYAPKPLPIGNTRKGKVLLLGVE